MHNAFPNEALVRVHLINSFVISLLWLLITIVSIVGDEVANSIYEDISFYYVVLTLTYDVFSSYMDLFLIYLIFRFTKEGPTVTDEMPPTLFMQNQ